MYNTEGKVINKDLQILDHYETTYNFEVEDNHNYYVSDECILVHNDCTKANTKNYSAKEIAKQHNITVEDFHKKVKPKIKSLAPPNHKVGKNPNIVLTRKGNIGYVSANGKMFQDIGLNIKDIIKELNL